MSQEDVMRFLENRKNEWYSMAEIAKAVGIGEEACQNNVRKLLWHKEVVRRDDLANVPKYGVA